MQSVSDTNEQEIAQIELKLKAKGYRRVSSEQKLQKNEYCRSEGGGTENSFEGPKKYLIEWE